MMRQSMPARWVGIFCAAVLGLFTAGCAPSWSESQTFVMNTVLSQNVEGSQDVTAENEKIARDLENKLSRTLEESEVARAVRSEAAVSVSEDTQTVARVSLEAWKETNGAFDPALGAFRDAWGFGQENPAVPKSEEIEALLAAPGAESIVTGNGTLFAGGAQIDFGGAAKGYALDKMRENMESQDVRNALVSFGGAVLAMGERQGGGRWRIGIRDPFSDDASSYIGTFELSDEIVQTSGISEQSFTENGVTYHHILDPQTGMPADNSLAAVSVVGESGIMTDIYSTALFVMGMEDGLRFADEHGIKALFISRDKKIRMSSDFDCRIQDLDSGYAVE